MKLLVWEDNGRIAISQHGGMSKSVIDAYGRDGKTARFFDALPNNPGGHFVEGERLRKRPTLKARLNRTEIPAGGQASIYGVPSGATIVISDGLNSDVQTAEGGVVHVAIEDRGRYMIDIEAFPHLHKQFALTVK